MKALVLDNRDSFVFNLVEELRGLDCRCQVVRSDLELDRLEALLDESEPALVLVSPGPGRPEDHPVLLPFLRTRPKRAVLGICLGLQAMVRSLGGAIGAAHDGPVHGRATRVVHEDDPLFDGLPSGFPAGRYHSLAARTLPDELEPIAWTEDRETVMALRHRSLPWVGLQFHPESVLTPRGRRLLSNFVRTVS